MGPLARLVGGGIGLATEANAARKKSHSAQSQGERTPHGNYPNENQYPEQPPPYLADGEHEKFDESDADEHDEQDWQMDEAQDEFNVSFAQSFEQAHGVDEVVKIFFQRHQPPANIENVHEGLASPVIIPQRRPGTRTRGWIRAYAPDLETAGIDQPMFMDFLEGFEKAIKLSPVFHAAQLGVVAVDKAVFFAAGFMPIMKLVSLAAHTSIEASRRTYTNVRTNSYLDQMNEHLFKPQGLFAMIVTYKPSSRAAVQEVDLSSKIAITVANRDSGKTEHFWTQSAGKTRSELELPDAAPLVFPQLEALPEDRKENTFKKLGHSLQDYNDRKARARFEAANPNNSKLNVLPSPEFASRFSDPNHPARSGGLVALATGGTVVRPTIRDRIGGIRNRASSRRQHITGRSSGPIRDISKQIRGKSDESPGIDAQGKPLPKQKRQRRGISRRLLQESTLYLMVVNIPTEEEIREALAEVEAAKEAAKHNSGSRNT